MNPKLALRGGFTQSPQRTRGRREIVASYRRGAPLGVNQSRDKWIALGDATFEKRERGRKVGRLQHREDK